jgi:hypothetical protein
MNDVSNRAVREFSEFLNSIEADFPKPTCTTAYEITMKSTIVSALITLDTEKQMDERFWNHLRVQRNILDFLYTLWLDDDRTLANLRPAATSFSYRFLYLGSFLSGISSPTSIRLIPFTLIPLGY